MIRLYILGEIEGRVALTPPQLRYLKTVMRRKSGDIIRIFNGEDGEWEAQLAGDFAIPTHQTVAPHVDTNKFLVLSKIKPSSMEFAIQKSVEIGIGAIYIIKTDRSHPCKYNYERLEAIAIEAAEQCGRLSVPSITEIKDLSSLGKVGLCVQGGSDSVGDLDGRIVGPEGGWSNHDMVRMGVLPRISLCQNTLRAETAACVASFWLCGSKSI